MTAAGICDRVAIVGMGCTRFAEHWDKSIDDLLVDAVTACVDSVPALALDDVEAFWVGTKDSGQSGMMLSHPLKLDYRPVTRVENFCATGSETLRNACYAVASGAYDVAMAVGVEKLKDSGLSGLTIGAPPNDGTAPEMTPPAMFSLLAPAYAERYGVDRDQLKAVLSRIAHKNHLNGERNPLAQFRKAPDLETIANSPLIAGMLGVYDCSGVADGAAAAIVVRAEDAHRYTERPMYVKALALASGPADGAMRDDYDYTTFPEVVRSAQDAYRQAGISDPRAELSLAEVHDCFTPTELVLMEDLGFSERGSAWRDVLDGVFDLDGTLPVNSDGGLKSFGHPIGASGLRMQYELWLQFRGEAGERQLERPTLGLTHNLGGQPGGCVSFVSVVGTERNPS